VQAVFRHAIRNRRAFAFRGAFRADQHGLTIRSKSACPPSNIPSGEYPSDEVLVPGEAEWTAKAARIKSSIERQSDGDLPAKQDTSVPVMQTRPRCR
jgi:hypothetical protein